MIWMLFRLSQNIKKNLIKENNQIQYNEKNEDDKTDFKLANRDQVINFYKKILFLLLKKKKKKKIIFTKNKKKKF